MINQVVLIGKLIDKNEEGTLIEIEVPRNYKSEESDKITINILGNIACNIQNYCEIGCLVGVKGRIVETKGIIEIVAEKITMLQNEKGE